MISANRESKHCAKSIKAYPVVNNPKSFPKEATKNFIFLNGASRFVVEKLSKFRLRFRCCTCFQKKYSTRACVKDRRILEAGATYFA